MKRRTSIILAAVLLVSASLAITAKLRGAINDPLNPATIADLQGSYAGKSIGFTTVCTNAGGCSLSTPNVVSFHFAAVAHATVDATGNFCATATNSNAPVGGSPTAASISNRTISGNITSFDAASLQGDITFHIYEGGACKGATFDSTGATLTTNATGHVIVSDGGQQVDGIATSYVSVSGIVGSVVNSVTFRKQ